MNKKITGSSFIAFIILVLISIFIGGCVSLPSTKYKTFILSGIDYKFIKVFSYLPPENGDMPRASSGDKVVEYKIDDTLLGIRFDYKNYILGTEQKTITYQIRRDFINDTPFIYIDEGRWKIGKITSQKFDIINTTGCKLIKTVNFKERFQRFNKPNLSIYTYDLSGYTTTDLIAGKCFLTDFPSEFPFFVVDILHPEYIYFIVVTDGLGGAVDYDRVNTLDFYK